MATKGLALLVELLNIAKDELVIMPGGGINDQNCEVFLKKVLMKYIYPVRVLIKQLMVNPFLI